MRVLIDACVLFPTIPRLLLLGCADEGLIVPIWSARILEEWRRAVIRVHPEQAAIVQGEIAMVQTAYPGATVVTDQALEAGLSLPDDNDRHVLAAAIAGGADALVTRNLRDFPGRTLAQFGIIPRAPDSVLLEFARSHPDVVRRLANKSLSGMVGAADITPRSAFKRAGLPRLAKAIFS
ncbi:PIN domain-containing protein [Rhodobacteraceae bacterium SC52]|nr:PIN domain-containing protein [Rhodobacteraceae bacterium SC52]